MFSAPYAIIHHQEGIQMDAVKIGGLICRLRKEQGMTQAQLAQAIHVSSKAVSKWETGVSLR